MGAMMMALALLAVNYANAAGTRPQAAHREQRAHG